MVLLLLGVGSPAQALGLPAPAGGVRPQAAPVHGASLPTLDPAALSQVERAAPCFSPLPARPQSLPQADDPITTASEPELAATLGPGPWADASPEPEVDQISDPGDVRSSLLTGAPARGWRRLGRCDLHWPDRLSPHAPDKPIPDAALPTAVLREAPAQAPVGGPRLDPLPQDERLLSAAAPVLTAPRVTARLLLPPPLPRPPQASPEPLDHPPRW